MIESILYESIPQNKEVTLSDFDDEVQIIIIWMAWSLFILLFHIISTKPKRN